MEDGELYKHDCHGNNHRLRFHIKATRSYTCNGCKLPGDSYPYFKCTHENCVGKSEFFLHQICYKSVTLDSRLPPFFDCRFDYLDSPLKDVSDHCGDSPYYCDACGLDIEGFMRYRCSGHPNNIYHDLHPTCADLKHDSTITDENGIVYKLEDGVRSKCRMCKKRYPVEECIRFTGWKWVSQKKYWSFSFCFMGRKKKCYHLKCMNKISAAR